MINTLKYFVTDRGGWDGGTLLAVTCNPEWDGQDAWDNGYVEEIRQDWNGDMGYHILAFNDSCDGALIIMYENNS